MNRFLDEYRFAEAYDALYHFVWDEVADWYVEASKTSLNPGVLNHILESTLKLAHPFAPFVTETIWQTLQKREGEDMLAVSPWPKPYKVDAKEAADFQEVQTIVEEIRYIRSILNGRNFRLLHAGDEFISNNASLIKALSGITGVAKAEKEQGLHLTQTNRETWLDLDEHSITQFKSALKDKLSEQEQSIKRLEGRLSNKNYVKSAPKALVDETREQLEAAKALRDKTKAEYDRFTASS